LKSPWLPWVIVAVLLGGGLFLLDQNRADKRALADRLKKSEEQNAILADKVIAAAEKSAQAEQALERLEAQASRREAALIAALSHVQTATPQQLIDDGSRLLRATDITLSPDGKSVTLGLETWRRAVSLMVMGDEYEARAKPAWAEQTKAWADASAALHAEIDAHKNAEAGLTATIKDLSAALGHEKRATTLEKALWGVAGIGLGMAVEKIIK
jgi:hypothetical protein